MSLDCARGDDPDMPCGGIGADRGFSKLASGLRMVYRGLCGGLSIEPRLGLGPGDIVDPDVRLS